jgi:hypothetical protein
MTKTQNWTVVRFPDGSWSYGGLPNDPAYEFCEKWSIPADSARSAVKRAQGLRRNAKMKADRAARVAG